MNSSFVFETFKSGAILPHIDKSVEVEPDGSILFLIFSIVFLEEENHDCDSEVYIAYLLLERDKRDNNIDSYSNEARNKADRNFDLPLEEAKIQFAENKIFELLLEIKHNIEDSQYQAIKHSMSPSKYAERLFNEDYLAIEVEGTTYIFKRD